MKLSLSSTTTLTLLFSSTINAQSTYEIDPNSVSLGTKQGWCQQQQAQCPLICLQTSADSSTTESNDCDPVNLTFACVCANGLSPNLTEYSQTLPYYICQEWGSQCVSNCGAGNNACAAACRDDHPCGALSPSRGNASLTSGPAATTTTIGAQTQTSGLAAPQVTNSLGTVYSGLAGAAATGGSGGTSGSQAVRAGQALGMLGVAAVLAGALAIGL